MTWISSVRFMGFHAILNTEQSLAFLCASIVSRDDYQLSVVWAFIIDYTARGSVIIPFSKVQNVVVFYGLKAVQARNWTIFVSLSISKLFRNITLSVDRILVVYEAWKGKLIVYILIYIILHRDVVVYKCYMGPRIFPITTRQRHILGTITTIIAVDIPPFDLTFTS